MIVNVPPLYIPVTYDGGIGNTLKGFISALGITDNVIIVPNLSTRLGNYAYVLNHDQIGFKETRESFSSCRFLVLKDEENEQINLPNEFSNHTDIDLDNKKLWPLFSKKVLIDWYYDKSLLSNRVYERIVGAVKKIQWQTRITSKANEIFSNLPFPTLAVSIRSWNALHPGDRGCTRPYNKNIYIDAIKKMTDTYKIESIFMSYDNIKYESEYSDFLKDYHINKYIGEESDDPLEVAIINILVLSKCKYYVCNRISTFAEIVFWVGECKQIVKSVY